MVLINRKPWERRLEDLAHLLRNCSRSYFDPDLFRRYTNQFLQTARTITFIIQKNKTEIPAFDSWYRETVLTRWTQDQVMKWAKDARNKIEKEGDLDVASTLKVSLIYSYLEEEDIVIPCGRTELINAGVKRLIRFAQKNLPGGISDAAGIRIERSWVSAGLESTELLQALVYTYSRIYDCCKSLAVHLERSLPNSIPEPSEMVAFGNAARHVQMVKFRGLKSYRIKTGRVRATKADEVPQEIKDRARDFVASVDAPHEFRSAVSYYQGMAQSTFNEWKNHMAMLFLLDHDWSVQDMITPLLSDQTDKYFFWRMIAERVRIQKPKCLVFTGEVWIRDLSKQRPWLAIRQLPIKGECLQTCLVDRDGNRAITTWDIERNQSNLPTLGPPIETYDSDQQIFFLVPVMRSMGIEPNFVGEQKSAQASGTTRTSISKGTAIGLFRRQILGRKMREYSGLAPKWSILDHSGEFQARRIWPFDHWDGFDE